MARWLAALLVTLLGTAAAQGCLPPAVGRLLDACTFWAPPQARQALLLGTAHTAACEYPRRWRLIANGPTATRNASVVVFDGHPWDAQIVLHAQPTLVLSRRELPALLDLGYLPTSLAGGFHLFLHERQHHWVLPSLDQEDLYAFLSFFHQRTRPGVFLELGGADGVTQSNTLFFERQLAWKGYLVEGNNAQLMKARRTRPHSNLINAVVCEHARRVHWIGRGLTAGVVEFMQPTFLRKWYRSRWAELADALGHSGGRPDPTGLDRLPWLRPLPCAPLGELLPPGVQHIDFFSLDVEGAELQVIHSIDFSELFIDVVVVECDGRNATKDRAVRRALQARGMRFVAKYRRNEWFRNGRGPTRGLPREEP